MKKVLHILRSTAWGGLELYTLDFIAKMQSTNIDQILFCLPHSKVAEAANQRGIKVTHSIGRVFLNWDIVHVHERGDLLLARFSLCFRPKTRFVYTLMMNAPAKKRPHHYWIYQRVDHIISSSHWVIAEIKKNFPVKAQAVQWIPYGRSFEHQPVTFDQKLSLRAKLLLPIDKIIFISVCRIDKGKGVVDLAHALKHLAPEVRQLIQIVIIGDPTLERMTVEGTPVYEKQSEKALKDLQLVAQEFPDSFRHVSYQKNIYEWLQAADFFVLASWLETYALAVLDAMSVGLSVIGSKSGGTIEQIGQEGQRGLFFQPKEAQSIADAITLAVTHYPQLIKLGEAAYIWVIQTHQWSRTIAEFNRIYQTHED